ncbi:unnamed protein product [Arctia plantaginis]|uniref:Uncharacterized protein n=1 Tax=Arctia plantaginis TaxID=874455 RepID=A0A8S1AJF8_ARCPL|nr:unnamed protein product [Arctia plantaginis]
MLATSARNVGAMFALELDIIIHSWAAVFCYWCTVNSPLDVFVRVQPVFGPPVDTTKDSCVTSTGVKEQ